MEPPTAVAVAEADAVACAVCPARHCCTLVTCMASMFALIRHICHNGGQARAPVGLKDRLEILVTVQLRRGRCSRLRCLPSQALLHARHLHGQHGCELHKRIIQSVSPRVRGKQDCQLQSR